MMWVNCYDIFNLPSNCSSRQIHEKFYHSVLTHHPQKNSEQLDDQQPFIQLFIAFEILAKKKSRLCHDFLLEHYSGRYKLHQDALIHHLNYWKNIELKAIETGEYYAYKPIDLFKEKFKPDSKFSYLRILLIPIDFFQRIFLYSCFLLSMSMSCTTEKKTEQPNETTVLLVNEQNSDSSKAIENNVPGLKNKKGAIYHGYNELANQNQRDYFCVSDYNTDNPDISNIKRPNKSFIETKLNMNLLCHVWTSDPNGPHADFVITKDFFSVTDYDGNGDMPYSLIGDELTVYYNDFIQKGTIISIQQDSLKIQWSGFEFINTYSRWPNN